MSEPLLKVVQLRKSFGGVVATDSLDFDVMPGEIHAVIGPNGAGKTTFVAQIAGMLKSDSGTITFDGRDMAGKTAPERSHMGLARSFQITSVFRDFTRIGKRLSVDPGPCRPQFQILEAGVDRQGPDRPGAENPRRCRAWRQGADACRQPGALASSASWKSRWRWRPARRCCCSMSRRRAWGPRNRRPCGPFSTR